MRYGVKYSNTIRNHIYICHSKYSLDLLYHKKENIILETSLNVLNNKITSNNANGWDGEERINESKNKQTMEREFLSRRKTAFVENYLMKIIIAEQTYDYYD